MTVANKYLVQALRAYREVSVGQFDQQTLYKVQLTDDAADEIERLNAQVEALTKREVSLVKDQRPNTSGWVQLYGWDRLAALVEKDEPNDPWKVHTLVVEQNGITLYGGTAKKL